jgi:hypothetical protein
MQTYNTILQQHMIWMSVTIAGLYTGIWTWGLQNTKQEN